MQAQRFDHGIQTERVSRSGGGTGGGVREPEQVESRLVEGAGAGDRFAGVPGKLRIRELLEAPDQGNDYETGQSVCAVSYDAVGVQPFAWPVRRPLELGRDLLFERQAVIDLPPVGQRFAGRQCW